MNHIDITDGGQRIEAYIMCVFLIKVFRSKFHSQRFPRAIFFKTISSVIVVIKASKAISIESPQLHIANTVV